MRRFGATLLVVAAFALPPIESAQSQGQRLYRYTDENGVIRYTDKIPPEYADRDRNLLNDQGVRIGFEEGEITAASLPPPLSDEELADDKDIEQREEVALGQAASDEDAESSANEQ